MSADLLRRAAASMRERAEAATAGEWVQNGFEYEPDSDVFTYDVSAVSDPVVSLCYADKGNAEHIASWHPAVAVTVANLLEDIATGLDLGLQNTAIEPFAFAAARAYLGEDA